MSELPCVGAGITVVDPGASTNAFARGRGGFVPLKKQRKSSRASWHEPALRLLKAYVTEVDPYTRNDGLGSQILWKCGKREGSVFQKGSGSTWISGHGPQARGALLAAHALEQQRP